MPDRHRDAMTDRYTVHQISGMLGLTARQIRSYVTLGILEPEVGVHGRFEFSFRDLVVLRTAKGLLDGNVPAAQIHAALVALCADLDGTDPLATFSVVAQAGRIVVMRDEGRWEPVSGQEIFDLDLDTLTREAAAFRLTTRTQPRQDADAESWFLYGDELEGSDVERATTAYERAIALDPAHVDAHISLGRMLHGQRSYTGAIAHFRTAIEHEQHNTIAWFDLGVVLEDSGNPTEAIDAYLACIEADRSMADAHRNIAALYEKAGRTIDAFRHHRAYRDLTAPARD